MKVQFNSKQENPFYGLKYCLSIYQNVDKVINFNMLDLAYNEVKNNKIYSEMFYSLLFSIGDITNRQHNIFGKNKIDTGGNASCENFYTIMQWMKSHHYQQFIKFMNSHLFNEYVNFDNLFKTRIRTVKKKQEVVAVYNSLEDPIYCNHLSDYIITIINGNNPFDKMLVAKFLTLPRLSKRSKSKRLLNETYKVMQSKAKFLAELSKKMNWEFTLNKNYANFKGYRNWRKSYNSDLESVLFSTGKIMEFDEVQFIQWLNKIPSQSRFRVKSRIMYEKDGKFKYPKLKKWFTKWECYKEEKQAEERALQEKIRQGTATVDDTYKLKEIKKEAKVTIGAVNFTALYNSILNNDIDRLLLESFINKVNLPYNSLTIIDDSGSMRGAPFNFAIFMAAICLVKNLDDNGRNLLGFFNNSSRLYGYIDSQSKKAPNSILKSNVTQVMNQPFVNPELSFYKNYERISSFCYSVFQGGGTNLSSLPEGFKRICDKDSQILDSLKEYSIWTIISDGDINNCISNEASMNDFFRKCENLLGFKPFLICININKNYNAEIDRFRGIDNMIVVNSNPAQIEQILTNFKDIDIYDVYTPLQSIWRSNRYQLVRENLI